MQCAKTFERTPGKIESRTLCCFKQPSHGGRRSTYSRAVVGKGSHRSATIVLYMYLKYATLWRPLLRHLIAYAIWNGSMDFIDGDVLLQRC